MKKKTESVIITQAEAARRAGVSRQYIRSYIESNNPKFMVEDKFSGIIKIDSSHSTWKHFVKSKLLDPKRKPVKKNSKSTSENSLVKNLLKLIEDDENKNKDVQEILELAKKSEKARMETDIYKAEITKQKSEQEKIKTLQLKKHVAPIELIAYAFSFNESYLQESYRRIDEIAADLESMFLAGEKEKAINKIKRELESGAKHKSKSMIEDMKKEKYDIGKYVKK